jgi:acetolactate synthase-1/2/3 large subunit
VHVHSGAEELGRVYQGTLMINAGMPEIAAALGSVRVDSAAWRHRVEEARAEYEAWQERPPTMKTPVAGVDLWEMIQTLRAKLPPDAIITNGAGNFATWAHRFWRYAPVSDHPLGQTAKLAQPDRTVVCFAGDGDFLMTGQELATAVQYGAGIVVLLFDNGMYGTIRMHQEREFPARVVGSELHNPDFVRYCEAFGGFGVLVETSAQFAPALDEALAFAHRHGKPALVHMKLDPEAISPNLTLSQVRSAGGRRA